MIASIEAALEARIQSIPNEPVIAWWGRPFTPTKGQAYLAAEITARHASPIALGEKAAELWEGFLQLTVVHPTAEGPAAARARAEAIRNHFPRGLTMTSGSAQVVVMGRSIQPAFPAIDWLNYPVLINWICEEIPA